MHPWVIFWVGEVDTLQNFLPPTLQSEQVWSLSNYDCSGHPKEEPEWALHGKRQSQKRYEQIK